MEEQSGCILHKEDSGDSGGLDWSLRSWSCKGDGPGAQLLAGECDGGQDHEGLKQGQVQGSAFCMLVSRSKGWGVLCIVME